MERNSFTSRKGNKIYIINDSIVKESIQEFKADTEQYFNDDPSKTLWVNMDKTLWVNMDETRVELDIRENQMITKIRKKSVIINRSNEGMRQTYTVIVLGLNTGKKLPPMIIFNGSGAKLSKKLDKKDCEIWFNGNTSSAYNSKEGHQIWIDNVFLKNMDQDQLSNNILFLDTCGSIHCEYKETEVNYRFFKPNTTSIFQPIDLSVNKPFKAKLRALQEEQYINNQKTSEKRYFKKLDRQSFINIVTQAWSTISEQQIINGFNEIKKIYEQYQLKYLEVGIVNYSMDVEKEGNMNVEYQHTFKQQNSSNQMIQE